MLPCVCGDSGGEVEGAGGAGERGDGGAAADGGVRSEGVGLGKGGEE